jgi:sugar phosphate isomerase/epimerase
MTITNQPDIQLGVSLYSYGGDYLVTMTLEDCLADIADMGATGVEILADTHIPNYPNPSAEWIEEWHRLVQTYGLTPTCYSCWLDTRLYKDRPLSLDEAAAILRRDLELAHKLGFTLMRPKIGVVSLDLVPDSIWRPAVEQVLPEAQQYNIRITPEIHSPTPLKSTIVDDYLALVKETGTANFGLLVDTSIFQDRTRTGVHSDSRYIFGADISDPAIRAEVDRAMSAPLGVDPADLAEVMPYVYHVQAKFWDMTDDLTDPHIPWDKFLKALVEGGYQGSLSSEYEGARDLFLASDMLRRQHVMIRRLLAEYGVSVPTNNGDPRPVPVSVGAGEIAGKAR